MMPVYLDCNATTPIDPRVRAVLLRFLDEEYGNEGSRTHQFGAHAKQAVQMARDQIAEVVGASRDEVIFTSGATESNNLAILGLRAIAEKEGRRHIVTTTIEHKAVLGPIQALGEAGFEITYLTVGSQGFVDPEAVKGAMRPDTILVSIMQANNETGVKQPLLEIVGLLGDHTAYFHTDAAQGFGKDLSALRHPRIDLISISGHKIYAPKGVGALVVRKRGYQRVPLQPLMYGGGQERNLRPGTLPVPLVAALGEAARLAASESERRNEDCRVLKSRILAALEPLSPRLVGDQAQVMDHVLNFAIPGLDSEALMVAMKESIAISNGSACTSSTYAPSYVLMGMGLSEKEASECCRISWCHLTENVDWHQVAEDIRRIL